GWNEVRERALERDDRTCVVCGTGADELGRNPDVHHIVPLRAFVESPVLMETDAHTIDNVVSLCPSCHRKAEFGHFSRAELRWRSKSA
ncbi:MAG: HNH endonuclease signature motif containing protein, partial [Haloarculaceae archaeon]